MTEPPTCSSPAATCSRSTPSGGSSSTAPSPIAGGRIVAVGTTAEVRRRAPGRAELDATGCVVTPGFVNTHQHTTGDPLARSCVPDDLPPGESIFSWAVPAERRPHARRRRRRRDAHVRRQPPQRRHHGDRGRHDRPPRARPPRRPSAPASAPGSASGAGTSSTVRSPRRPPRRSPARPPRSTSCRRVAASRAGSRSSATTSRPTHCSPAPPTSPATAARA